jgi:hypothetical protein
MVIVCRSQSKMKLYSRSTYLTGFPERCRHFNSVPPPLVCRIVSKLQYQSFSKCYSPNPPLFPGFDTKKCEIILNKQHRVTSAICTLLLTEYKESQITRRLFPSGIYSVSWILHSLVASCVWRHEVSSESCIRGRRNGVATLLEFG